MKEPGQTLRSTLAPDGFYQVGDDLPVVASATIPATTAAVAAPTRTARLREAVRAVDRLVAPWLEWHACLVAAGGARCRIHLAVLATVPAAPAGAVAAR